MSSNTAASVTTSITAAIYQNPNEVYLIPEIDISVARAARFALAARTNNAAAASATASATTSSITVAPKLSEEQMKADALVKAGVEKLLDLLVEGLKESDAEIDFSIKAETDAKTKKEAPAITSASAASATASADTAAKAFDKADAVTAKVIHINDLVPKIKARFDAIGQCFWDIQRALAARHKAFMCEDHPCLCLKTQRNIKYLQGSVDQFNKYYANYEIADPSDKEMYQAGIYSRLRSLLKKVHTFIMTEDPFKISSCKPFRSSKDVDFSCSSTINAEITIAFDFVRLAPSFNIENFRKMLMRFLLTTNAALNFFDFYRNTRHREKKFSELTIKQQNFIKEALQLFLKTGAEYNNGEFMLLNFCHRYLMEFCCQHGMDLNDQGVHGSLAGAFLHDDENLEEYIGRMQTCLDLGFDLRVFHRPLSCVQDVMDLYTQSKYLKLERERLALMIAFGIFDELLQDEAKRKDFLAKFSSHQSEFLSNALTVRQQNVIDNDVRGERWTTVWDTLLPFGIITDLFAIIKAYGFMTNQQVATDVWRQLYPSLRWS